MPEPSSSDPAWKSGAMSAASASSRSGKCSDASCPAAEDAPDSATTTALADAAFAGTAAVAASARSRCSAAIVRVDFGATTPRSGDCGDSTTGAPPLLPPSTSVPGAGAPPPNPREISTAATPRPATTAMPAAIRQNLVAPARAGPIRAITIGPSWPDIGSCRSLIDAMRSSASVERPPRCVSPRASSSRPRSPRSSGNAWASRARPAPRDPSRPSPRDPSRPSPREEKLSG